MYEVTYTAAITEDCILIGLAKQWFFLCGTQTGNSVFYAGYSVKSARVAPT